MALIALLNGPAADLETPLRALQPRHVLVRAPNQGGLVRLVRDRPVSLVVVDFEALGVSSSRGSVLDELRASFPRMPIVVGIDALPDPNRLVQLGRHRALTLVTRASLDSARTLERLVHRQLRKGPRRIPALLGQFLPVWTVSAIARAFDSIDKGWTTDDFSAVMRVRRPWLSRRLRDAGLPPAGELLRWVKVFHAAWWLPEPGRTCGTVASQLEYSSSQSLVRVVGRVLGATPGQLIARGGLDWAWLRFLQLHPRLVSAQGGSRHRPLVAERSPTRGAANQAIF